MKITLRILDKGDDQPREIELEGNMIVLGRHATQLRLASGRCSRFHASIYENEPGDLRIADMQSRNGTWVNGVRTEQACLQIGSFIRLGGTKIQVVRYEPSPWVAPAEGLLPIAVYEES